MFPEEAHEFLTNFFSEVIVIQTLFIGILDFITLPSSYLQKLNEDQWEKKLESLMEVKGNSKKTLPILGNKAIKASAYRKSVMNQNGNMDRADDIAYTLNQQNSYEISATEGRPYVIETNKKTNDFI
ncbi:20330_t:CDS:2 [Rhizophagus irregularis]|nr:20330_t:CDS:2 [Rhizophagus irregularis]